MPHFIIKIPRKVLNCKPLAHPMSFADNYPYEQMLREVATLERQPHNISTRIDDVLFVWCRYMLLQVDTEALAIEKANELDWYNFFNENKNGFIVPVLLQ